MKKNRVYSPDWSDYELIDAGNNEKLERWGNIITIRPERQAYFQPELSSKEWLEMAHLKFEAEGKKSGIWKELTPSPKEWKIDYKDLSFLLHTTRFKHVGLFPEQMVNWEVISQFLKPKQKMLNLFAYTGAASIIGRKTGAEVTHVDAVKQLITWARENMQQNNLTDIRWICEDALKFARKEQKRKHHYHLIIMDPPAYGIGTKKEKWKIEQKLEELVQLCHSLLAPKGMLILNTYTPKVTYEKLYAIGTTYFKDCEIIELWKKTTTGKKLYYGNLLRGHKK